MQAMRITLAAATLVVGGAAAAQDEDDPGFKLYQQNCRTCHVMEEGDNRLGPSLHGVVGRAAGSLEGFAYSPSMDGSEVVWDEASLDAFLEDPGAFMPGNRMLYPGMPSAEDRAAVIAYMAAGE